MPHERLPLTSGSPLVADLPAIILARGDETIVRSRGLPQSENRPREGAQQQTDGGGSSDEIDAVANEHF